MLLSRSHIRDNVAAFAGNRGAALGSVVIGTFVLAAALAPVLAPYGPFEISGPPLLAPRSDGHVLGTDFLGRDTLSQVLYGARVSLLVGLLAAAVSLTVGTIVGSLAGYIGGGTDSALMRLTEAFQVLPNFLVALVVVAVIGPGAGRVILVIGLLAWPPTARLVRSQFLSLREQEFVQAARVVGVGRPRIMWGEVLPNAMPPAIAVASLDVARAILLEAGLSFLGLGDPDVLSWGIMLKEAGRFLQTAWWLSVFPGVAIFVVVIAFNLIGDGITDALNPRLRRR